jgi:hypothetical protein
VTKKFTRELGAKKMEEGFDRRQERERIHAVEIGLCSCS